MELAALKPEVWLPKEPQKGFTLAELLIALAILGEIATFTIPKIIHAQQNGSFKAKAKETAAMLAGAFQQYQLSNSITSSTKPADLTPYMNYVKVDSTTSIDLYQNLSTVSCGAGNENCLLLHNGGMLRYRSDINMGGTNTTNAIYFSFDPDGKVTDGTTNGPGKALTLFVYYNGRITSWCCVTPNAVVGASGTFTPNATTDPPWFSW
jgi:prepilin-type N-terminal cleavage/methylation domain-containing protein